MTTTDVDYDYIGMNNHLDNEFDHNYIVKGYTEDQRGQDIRDQDVIRAANGKWFTFDECLHFKEKSFQRAPTYGTCPRCWMSGPLNLFCRECMEKRTGGRPIHGFVVMKLTHGCDGKGHKIMDSVTLATWLKKGHQVAKVDRKCFFREKHQVLQFGFTKFVRGLTKEEREAIEYKIFIDDDA